MKILPDLKYTKNDEWIRVEGNLGVIGITDYAQDQLSDIVFMEVTAQVRENVKQGESFGSVESVKAASDVYAPASGTLAEVNEALADSPEAINTDPYGAAWMIKLTLSDPSELDGLMDDAAYKAYCQERSA